MHGMLSSEHLECWRHFVLACRIFCQRSISKDRLKVADILLLRFCQRTERQYERDIITPNMHMACHLSECVMDYGPLNHFWLFAFERFNGILGLLPNNNKLIETQMMRQFLKDQKVMWLPFPNEFQQDFEGLLASIRNDIPIDGTLASDSSKKLDFDVSNFSLTSGINITLSRSCIRSVFCETDLENIQQMYAHIYSTSTADVEVHAVYYRYMTVTIDGKVYGSYRSQSKHCSIILAKLNDEIRPTRINFFAKQCYYKSDLISHFLASLSWFQKERLWKACNNMGT